MMTIIMNTCGIMEPPPQVSADSWLFAALGYLDYLDLRVFRDRALGGLLRGLYTRLQTITETSGVGQITA
jgi:hypothetical protein